MQKFRVRLHLTRIEDGTGQNVVQVEKAKFAESLSSPSHNRPICLAVPHFADFVDIEIIFALLFYPTCEMVIFHYFGLGPLRLDPSESSLALLARADEGDKLVADVGDDVSFGVLTDWLLAASLLIDFGHPGLTFRKRGIWRYL